MPSSLMLYWNAWLHTILANTLCFSCIASPVQFGRQRARQQHFSRCNFSCNPLYWSVLPTNSMYRRTRWTWQGTEADFTTILIVTTGNTVTSRWYGYSLPLSLLHATIQVQRHWHANILYIGTSWYGTIHNIWHDCQAANLFCVYVKEHQYVISRAASTSDWGEFLMKAVTRFGGEAPAWATL